MSFHRSIIVGAAAFAASFLLAVPSHLQASPRLLVDAATGEVLFAEDAGKSWHPASLTKLMTASLAFKAMREGRTSPADPVIMTASAAALPPSKLGMPAESGLRLYDAIAIMLTRSMNDVAAAIGEHVGGSEKLFIDEMNREASRLGMRGTRFGNATGLPDEHQVTTAEDLAILARHIILNYPEHLRLFGIPELDVAGRKLRNTNGLVGHFEGSDGMKTGYICSSGFNVVSTATRNGRRLIAVVLGAPDSRTREKAASKLLQAGFASAQPGKPLSSSATAPSIAANMKKWKCGKTYPDFRTDVPSLSASIAPASERPQHAASRVRRF